jgi:hypothetical protein
LAEGIIHPLRRDFPSLDELIDVECNWRSAIFSLFQGNSKSCHLKSKIWRVEGVF